MVIPTRCYETHLSPVIWEVEILVWMKRIQKQRPWVCKSFPPDFLDKQKLPPFFHAEPPGLWPHTWDVSSLGIWLTCLSTLCLLLPTGIQGDGRNCATTWRFGRHTPGMFVFVWSCRGPGWKLISWIGSNILAMPREIYPQFPGSPASTLSLKPLLFPTLNGVMGSWGRGMRKDISLYVVLEGQRVISVSSAEEHYFLTCCLPCYQVS